MDFEALVRRAEEAMNGRANWESWWQDLADRVLPQMADFGTQRTPGEKRTEKMFDSSAALAATKTVAALGAFAYPANQQYQKLTTSNDDLNKVYAVKAYFEQLTKRLFLARYSPRASFESQMGEAALQHVVFGTGPMFVEDNVKKRALRYKSMHLAHTFMLEGADGQVDTVFHRFEWTLRQIEQKWPGRLPEALAKRLPTNPDEKVWVVHAICPREDYDPDAFGYLGMPWASVYWVRGEKSKLDEGGYASWPLPTLRYMTSAGEVYGRSPAWMAMSDIKVLNAMKRSTLQAAQKAVDPPLLATEDGVLGAFNQVPAAVNYGGLSPTGEPLVKPLITGAKVELGLEMMQWEEDKIAQHFMLDVFRWLIENPNTTATQVLEVMNERAVLVAPIVSRMESGFFSPLTERELQLLHDAGQLADLEIPPELVEAEGEYKIEFTSPMRRAMRSSEALGLARTLEILTPFSQIDPTVLDVFDTAQFPRELADINGVPANMLRSPEAVMALREQRADRETAAAVLEAAPALSDTAKNITQMQAAGGRPTV